VSASASDESLHEESAAPDSATPATGRFGEARERVYATRGIGLLAPVVTDGLWALLWWLISFLLLHAANLPWWGLLPGAIFFGLGTQVLHLATVYYFGERRRRGGPHLRLRRVIST
jgi:hypothetical protein